VACPCRWIEHNDTLPCGCPYNGKNPVSHINEQHCLDIDRRRRSGLWKTSEGDGRPPESEWNAEPRQALGEWRLRDIEPKFLVALNASTWDAPVDPSWQERDRLRFAGVWEVPPDPIFLAQDGAAR
jgi:hypothetical protein